MNPSRRSRRLALLMLPALLALSALAADGEAPQAAAGKPNIVIIWGDDVGQSNISACSHGVMGYKTPNIDRVAREGMMFTDYYAEQSCTQKMRQSHGK
jgi:hypothetical protein